MRHAGFALNAYLASCGVASRRKSADMVRSGRVKVNGRAVMSPGLRVDPERDRIEWDGRPLWPRAVHRYVLLNKPAGFLTTVSDDRGRRTVMDLLDCRERLFPVGRLDLDTEGLLLLTDDGQLANRLLHPRYGAEKVYQALVRGVVSASAIERLKRGVSIGEGAPVAGDARISGIQAGETLLEIRIHEGRKRQIRRMMEAVGHPVLHLKRIRFAGLTLGNLKSGRWRDLRPDEIKRLLKQA
ncbi:rRNA pseudouridine synthase [bacterium]|nr:rRNA pseudouridine synthase [bacterium]